MKTEKLTKAEFCIFAMLFLTSSFNVTNDIISSTVTIALWVLTAAFLCLSIHKMQTDQMVIFILLLASFAVSSVANSENSRNMMAVIFSFLVAFLYSTIYDFHQFQRAFIRVMKWLCIISLVGYVACSLVPSLREIGVVSNKGGVNYANFFIYVSSASGNRNLGMFWEPGAFQTFINIAFLFEIIQEKPDLKTIVIFVATIITTFSTTGYIAMAMILFLVFLHKNNMKNESLKTFIAFVFIILAVLVYFYQDFLLDTTRSSVFGKIINFFTRGQFNASGGSSSATVRFFAVTKPFEEFLQRPLFGWGYEGLIERTEQYTLTMNTCTFVNWLAVYGVTFGVTMLSGFVRLSQKIGKSMLAIVLVFLIFFVVTMSENYVNNAFFVLLVMYGFRKDGFGEIKNENLTNKRF